MILAQADLFLELATAAWYRIAREQSTARRMVKPYGRQ